MKNPRVSRRKEIIIRAEINENKIKAVKKDKEEHYIMVKRLVQKKI